MISLACAGMSTSEVEQIILYIVGILSALVSLSFNIWIWYKKAKADGKITVDEVKEGKETIENGLDDLASKAKNKGKEK